MLDWLLKNGCVVDGTGAQPYVADVGVRDGKIVEVGAITQPSKKTIDATGLWITPGFIDIHTHYDGQATWDDCFTPSIYHGVTTLVMGNCGVGFAPVRPGHEDDLIKLMEGVEDIPGAALHEGIRWNWETFPQYMDALAATPRSLGTGESTAFMTKQFGFEQVFWNCSGIQCNEGLRRTRTMLV